MIHLKKPCLLIVLTILAVAMNHCGGNTAEEAEKAFQNGNYKVAIQLFGEARQQNPDNPLYNERIALSYMYRGDEFFTKTGNIKSFEGNFEKATNFIPETPSPEFQKAYSDMLFKLARAYMKSTPQNDIQKEEFLNNALSRLEEALFQDESNRQADSLIAKIKLDNFQKMLHKGKDFYEKAGKQKNYDLYFSAEYYFKKAAYFDIHNEEVKKLLSRTREQTLKVLNYRDDLAIAIAEYQRKDGHIVMDLRLKSYLPDPLEINVDNFELYDIEGNTYRLDKEWMSKKLAKGAMKNTKLDAKKSFVDGIIVFNMPQKIKLEYLAYKINDDKVSRKYFP